MTTWLRHPHLGHPRGAGSLTGLHQSIVAHKEELEEAGWESTWSEDGSGLSIQSDGWTYVDISYTLMDGSYLTRNTGSPQPVRAGHAGHPRRPAGRPAHAPGLAGESYFHAQRRETGWWTPGSPTPIRTARLSPPPP